MDRRGNGTLRHKTYIRFKAIETDSRAAHIEPWLKAKELKWLFAIGAFDGNVSHVACDRTAITISNPADADIGVKVEMLAAFSHQITPNR